MAGFGGSLGESRGRITLDTGQADSAAEGLERRLQNMENAGGGIEALSGRFKAFGTVLTGVGAAITGALAVPITMGTKAAWGQVDAVEQATVALRAYGGSTEEVERQIANMVAYARSDMGVLFQRQDLFAAAQGLSVMGAETDRLSDYVEIMSRSVGVGASTWDELTQIIGRVGSTGQLTGYEFNALTKAGFQLDESLKGATVTWDELFAALDAGIPADAMAGQATTIRGMMIRLQSAIRGVGLAFLGVDADSSQFIEGGLGDTLKNGLDQARRAFVHLQGPAENFGKIVAVLARAVSGFIEILISLPTSLTSTIITLTGLVGVFSLVGGSAMLLVPKLEGVGRSLNGLMGLGSNAKAFDGFRLALTALRSNIGMIAPALAAVGVAILAFTAYQENFLGLKTIVDGLAKAFVDFGGVAITGILMATRGMSGLRSVVTALAVPFRVLMAVFPPLGIAVRAVAPWFAQLANVVRLAAQHIPIVGTAIARLSPVLSRLLGPIGLVITAVDLFRRNFMGIRDMVNDVIGVFSGLSGAFKDAFGGASEEAAIAAENVAEFAEATHVVDGVTVYTAFVTNAEGEKEAVGEIIESYKNADGMTAQVLISGDDGEYWATIDLATGEISNAEITVEATDDRGTIQKIIDGLEGMQAKANELGLGWMNPIIDGLQRVLGVVQTVQPYVERFFSRFQSYRGHMNPVSAAIAALGSLLNTINFGPFQTGMDLVSDGMMTFARGLQRVTDGIGMLMGAFNLAFQGKFTEAGNLARAALSNIADGFDKMGRSVMQITGGIEVALGVLLERFPGLANVIEPLIGLVNSLGMVFSQLFDVFEKLALGDWSGAWAQLGDVVRDIGRAFENFGALVSGIAEQVTSRLTALGERFPFLASMIEPLNRVITGVAGVISNLGMAIARFISGDWTGGLSAIGSAFGSLGDAVLGVGDFVQSIAGRLEGLFTGLANRFPMLEGLFNGLSGVIDAVADRFDGLSQVIGSLLKGDFSGVMSGLFDTLLGSFDILTSAAGLVGGILGDLAGILRGAVSSAVNYLAKRFSSFGNTIRRIGGVLTNALGVFEGLGDAIASLMRGDLSGFFSGIGDAAMSAIRTVGNMMTVLPTLLWELFTGVDWGGLWSGLVDGASSAWASVKSFFGSIDWGAIWDGLVAEAVAVWDELVANISNAWSEVQSFFSDIDWEVLWDGLVEGAEAVWESLSSTVSAAWDSITSVFTSFDWNSLWSNVGDIASSFVSNLGDLAGAVMEWIRGAAPSGEQIVSAIATAANLVWDVVKWFGALGSKVLSWLGDAAPSGEQIVSAIATAASLAWDVISWFGGLGSKVISWLTDAAPSGEDIVSAIATAANLAWDVISWFGGIGQKVIDWLTDAAPGAEAIVTAIASATDFAWDLIKWFGSLSQKVIDWLTDAAPSVSDIVDALFGALEWTADALSSVATGLIDAVKGAIDAAWEGLKGWAGELWDKLAGWLFGGSTEVDAGAVAGPLEDAVGGTTVDMSGLASAIAESLGNALSQLQDTSKIQAGLTGLMTKAAQDAASTGGLDFATVATLFMNQFIDAMLKAIGDDESGIGSSMAGAVENLFWQAAGDMDGRLDDDAEVIATAFNDALVSKIEAMDGTSLSGPIPGWISKAIEKASSDLDTVGETLATAVNDAVVSAVSELEEGGLGEALGGWFGRSITTFTEVATELSESIATLIGTTITTGMNELDESGLGSALGSWFGRSITTFTEVVESLSESVATLMETSIVGGVNALGGEGLGAALGAWFTSGVTSAQSAIDTATTTMMTSFNTKVTTELLNTKTAWQTHQTDVSSVLTTMSTNVGTQVDSMTNRMKTTWTTKLGETLTEVNRQYTAMHTAISTKLGDMLGRVNTDLNTMRSRFSTGMSDMRGTVDSGMGRIVSAVENGMRDFVRGIGRGMDDAASEARRGMDRIINAVSGFGGRMNDQGYTLGRQMGDGIARGIEGAIGRVTNAANRIVSEANRAARAAAEVKSPSRLFAVIGRFLTEGLAQGMTNNMALRKIVSGAEKIIDTASGRVSEGSLGELRSMQLQGTYDRYLAGQRMSQLARQEPALAGGGSITIVNVYTLPTDEWTRVQGQSGESANFVSTWSQQDVMSKFLPRR